jgi:nitric oxide reductase subunit B
MGQLADAQLTFALQEQQATQAHFMGQGGKKRFGRGVHAQYISDTIYIDNRISIFGFLINLPIISYFEVGTILTANHGHAALMGLFGMLGVALTVFAIRQNTDDAQFARIEPFIRIAFFGLNAGLALMVILSLFPGGILQLKDVLENGYWHARGLAYLSQENARRFEWIRLVGDSIFILFGALPMVWAAWLGYRYGRRPPPVRGVG